MTTRICDECGLPISECNRRAIAEIESGERRRRKARQLPPAPRRVVRVPPGGLRAAYEAAKTGDALVLD